jgi:hypothetical protein
MERNVGGFDRIARLVLGPLAALVGVGVLLGALSTNQSVGVLLVVAGVVLFLTGVTQRCLLHRLLGIDTCSQC